MDPEVIKNDSLFIEWYNPIFPPDTTWNMLPHVMVKYWLCRTHIKNIISRLEVTYLFKNRQYFSNYFNIDLYPNSEDFDRFNF